MSIYACRDCSNEDEDDYMWVCVTCNRELCSSCAHKHATKGHTIEGPENGSDDEEGD